MSKLQSLYVRGEQLAALARSPLLLLIRLYWGWQFAESGWGKLTNLTHVTQYFATLHLPAPGFTAAAIAVLELVGGVLLIAGIASRGIALVLACDMAVAYIVADSEALKSILSNPAKFYAADPFTFLFASVLIAVLGAGIFSADYLFAGKREVGCGLNQIPAE